MARPSQGGGTAPGRQGLRASCIACHRRHAGDRVARLAAASAVAFLLLPALSVRAQTTLTVTSAGDLVNALTTVATVDGLRRLQQRVLEIHVAPALLDYVQALVAHTRHSPGLNAGLSPRAAIGLLRAARAWALIAGRAAVIPEHVQAVFVAVVEHRVRQRDSGPLAITRLLEAVPIP